MGSILGLKKWVWFKLMESINLKTKSFKNEKLIISQMKLLGSGTSIEWNLGMTSKSSAPQHFKWCDHVRQEQLVLTVKLLHHRIG